MKRTLLLSAGLAAAATLNAQENPLHKKRVLLGFSVYGTTNTNRGAGTTTSIESQSFAVSPAVSYFYKDNNAIGLSFSLNKYEYNNASGPKPFQTSWSIAAERSRYWPIGAGFSLAGHLELAYQQSKSRNYENFLERRADGKGVYLSLTPGVTYAFRNRLLLELAIKSIATLGYAHNRTSDGLGNDTETSSYSFSTGIGQLNPLSFGINLLLGK
ncbi:MAG: hypothetical protein EOO16_11980 [Chitinophagaceae bacterium]|nr:MAG: hypothetical protein EOO16_11980 [Chitinophagaceae bacterium]